MNKTATIICRGCGIVGMGNTTHHRSTQVATEAIALALNGHQFTAGMLESHLQDKMDNPPSKNTIQTVLRQLREDDFLDMRNDMTMLSMDMQSWREGSYVPEKEIDAQSVAKEAAKSVSIDIEEAVMKQLTGDDYYYSHRMGKLKRKEPVE